MINNDAYLKAIDSMLENGDVQSPSGLMLLAYLREFRPPEFGYDGPADVCMTSRKICKAIEDMAEIDIDSVSKIMLALGYRPVYYDSLGLVWPMDMVRSEGVIPPPPIDPE